MHTLRDGKRGGSHQMFHSGLTLQRETVTEKYSFLQIPLDLRYTSSKRAVVEAYYHSVQYSLLASPLFFVIYVGTTEKHTNTHTGYNGRYQSKGVHRNSPFALQ